MGDHPDDGTFKLSLNTPIDIGQIIWKPLIFPLFSKIQVEQRIFSMQLGCPARLSRHHAFRASNKLSLRSPQVNNEGLLFNP